jgi:hypothetical protein
VAREEGDGARCGCALRPCLLAGAAGRAGGAGRLLRGAGLDALGAVPRRGAGGAQ